RWGWTSAARKSRSTVSRCCPTESRASGAPARQPERGEAPRRVVPPDEGPHQRLLHARVPSPASETAQRSRASQGDGSCLSGRQPEEALHRRYLGGYVERGRRAHDGGGRAQGAEGPERVLHHPRLFCFIDLQRPFAALLDVTEDDPV